MKPVIKLETRHVLIDKLKESLQSVLPIIATVALMCFLCVPVSSPLMLAFLIGAVLIVVGMALFSMGSEASLTSIGSHMSSTLTRSRKLWLIVGVSFALGVFVTVSEPDLQVLAQSVPHINNLVLIVTVGLGVGFFLALSMLRMIFGIKLRYLLLLCYGLVFLLAAFAPKEQLSVAFDSGGVTTGPMTVPFILAFGAGVSYIRSDKRAESDSFGLVALCSIGPVLSVLILSFFYRDTQGAAQDAATADWSTTTLLGWHYLRSVPVYMWDMTLSLSPILISFIVFQIASLKLDFKACLRILMGLVVTFAGLVLFLTGVNVGFSMLGRELGSVIASSPYRYLLIPLSALLGWFVISAEPAVYTLQKQIEEVSGGAIGARSVKLSLSVAIALANALAMLRALTGIPILWFILPGYTAALLLSFAVPDIYTAIAFDSGGVASGPLTAAFVLQLMIGACEAAGGSMLSDAFGAVALVALMPLITVQLTGLIARLRKRTAAREETLVDDEIIELMEVGE